MNLNHGDGHHAKHQTGHHTGSQTKGQGETTEKFNQARQQSQSGRQAQLGGKELAGGLDTVTAESTEELLAAMGHQ